MKKPMRRTFNDHRIRRTTKLKISLKFTQHLSIERHLQKKQFTARRNDLDVFHRRRIQVLFDDRTTFRFQVNSLIKKKNHRFLSCSSFLV